MIVNSRSDRRDPCPSPTRTPEQLPRKAQQLFCATTITLHTRNTRPDLPTSQTHLLLSRIIRNNVRRGSREHPPRAPAAAAATRRRRCWPGRRRLRARITKVEHMAYQFTRNIYTKQASQTTRGYVVPSSLPLFRMQPTSRLAARFHSLTHFHSRPTLLDPQSNPHPRRRRPPRPDPARQRIPRHGY